MLQLNNVVKTYVVGDTEIPALKGVSVDFRENEFVSILGPSGCGKTTLLNIIGGLDRYTSGDLVINGISTKQYKDSDWDLYRNHSIGFVFQNYNLIPHQSVLSNVELALTLSGVSKTERREKARRALEQVGLGDQIHKRPNQMSGGQMQRVAIARALVNDPDILLADEPTGALDTVTSIQIMELLKEIAKDRLIIMVTHNPELADKYSTRIIRLLDGKVIDDSNPYTASEEQVATVRREKGEKKVKKPSMSFFTAMSLSLNNLMTKKTRTFLTSFAGSIGIIGIALILALSNGITNFIGDLQRDTLASYPISIQKESTDMSSLITSIMGINSEESEPHENDKVYSSAVMYDLLNTVANADVKQNNISKFKQELLDNYRNNELKDYVTDIQYVYDTKLNVYVSDGNGEYTNADLQNMITEMYESAGVSFSSYSTLSTGFSSLDVWEEMLSGTGNEEDGVNKNISKLITDQYDLVYGAWPQNYDEVVLVVSENNEVSDMTLYSLGLMSTAEMQSLMVKAMTDTEYESPVQSWSYEEICDITFKVLLNVDYYKYNETTGLYDDIRENDTQLKAAIGHALPVKVVGIIRKNPDATTAMLNGSIAYTSALTDYVIETTANSDVVKAQLSEENKNRDVLTGMPFEIADNTEQSTVDIIKSYLLSLPDEKKQEIYLNYNCRVPEGYATLQVEKAMAMMTSREAIIETLASSMSMDQSDLEAYLADYTDEQLQDMIRESMTQMIETQYVESKKQEIIDSVSTPDEETLNYIRDAITAELTKNMSKADFIKMSYIKMGIPEGILKTSFNIDKLSDAKIDELFNTLIDSMVQEQAAKIAVSDATVAASIAELFDAQVNTADADELIDIYKSYASETSYEDNLKKLGVIDKDNPSSVNIYASTFESKDNIAEIIGDYNNAHEEEDRIEYTDYVALIMSSVTTIINIISYVLIAFVSISLVVSSIMIGIITYISVLERTKEIGVLRSIGASKRDISRVFNAETMIVGLIAGLIGIAITLVLCIPISLIVQSLSGISTIYATLPWLGGVILVVISVVLTLIAGLIPSLAAAKKDPVVALRSE